MKIIGNGRLITQNKKNPFIENGALVIKDGKILDYGNTSDILGKYQNAEYIDASKKVIMPGLINTHGHIYSAFARGMNLDGEVSKNFLDILNNLWWRLDKNLSLEDVKYSAYTTLMDSLKFGVTTFFDHHASPNAVTNSLFTIGKVAEELGIRTSLCYEVSDRDGEEILEKGIKENIDYIKYCIEKKDNMKSGMFGMHASFTLSDESLKKCVKEAEKLNCGYHIHVAEGMDDEEQCIKKHGKRVVERLNDFNILGEKTIAVHCIHADDNEKNLLLNTGTVVVHNPESNMGNAVGVSPAIELVNKGLTVGLGTDGYTQDMFESMKVANIIHKHNLKDPSVAWGEVPLMLFENNRKIAEKHFKGKFGIIEKGANADVIIVDYNPLTPMNASNYNSHILFGMMGKAVDTTIVNGRVLVRNGKLLNVNEEEILGAARKVSEKLWDRI
ncbi:putative selenium metabolism protein SsnA [Clostridium cavendishii DSM 21758]|uniref:Putative selenium metabolism protein SsnA n=1 Tax=Clostridium cavendishii DSM 21758 TaxID=1121302 RepID=A0A1M6DL44_9CLOT|nr:putative aminohydrolase SsnA [Clostridium cavendishii]SHI73843.1 putative selenium metabolism protein SsnA [Clostridium cavendishii DSM 21758]